MGTLGIKGHLHYKIFSFWPRIVLKLAFNPQGSHFHLLHSYPSCINDPYSDSMEEKPLDSKELEGFAAAARLFPPDHEIAPLLSPPMLSGRRWPCSRLRIWRPRPECFWGFALLRPVSGGGPAAALRRLSLSRRRMSGSKRFVVTDGQPDA